MSRTMPWFRFNAAQFLTDTAHLTDAEVGLHVRMLALYWHHGSVPNDPGWVKQRCPNAGSPRALSALDGLWEVEANAKQTAKQNLIPVALSGERPKSEEIREKRVLAGKKGGLASGEARREASASSTCRMQTQIQTQNHTQSKTPARAREAGGAVAPRPSASPSFDLDAALKGSRLDTPEFREAWAEFETMRASMPKRDQLTDQARRLALTRLRDAPPSHAVKALVLCAESRWKGVHFGLEAVAREDAKPAWKGGSSTNGKVMDDATRRWHDEENEKYRAAVERQRRLSEEAI